MTPDSGLRPYALPVCLLAAVVAISPAGARAQALAPASASLPQAPGVVLQSQMATGSIYGDVVDNHNGLVPQAKVHARQEASLVPGGALAPPLETTSDSAGHFSLAPAAAGTWRVEVSAPGFANFVAPRVVVKPGLSFELQGVVLNIAEEHADVTVTMTLEQVADQELHDQEHQRVLAIFPNYNTSYVWNAAPMNTRQKFALSAHSTFDPISLFTASLIAGEQQYRNTYPEFGSDAASYFKRYGTAYATTFIGHTIGYAILPSVFRQDPRYFYMGTGSKKTRAIHAILSSVLCRGDNGRTQFNVSHVTGNFIAGILSKSYYPESNSYASLAVNNMIVGTIGTSAVNLFREFGLRMFSTGTPKYGNGKPEGEATSAKHP